MIEIKLYGTSGCPHCSEAKELIEKSLNDGYINSFEYIQIQNKQDVEECSKAVGRAVERVPVILVNGKEYSFSSLKDMLS